MQFIYHEKAGEPLLVFEGEGFVHLTKARRIRSHETFVVQNMQDAYAYTYEVLSIDRKSLQARLNSTRKLVGKCPQPLFIGWAIVDPKVVEKTLPFLNELGVQRVSFVQSDYAQGNFKVDTARLKRILVNSSQQCGRHTWLEWEFFASVGAWLEAYPKGVVVDFSPQRLEATPEAFLVGPEGGFSPKERALFQKRDVVGMDSPFILRSESAVVGMAAKILL
jgi:16S rRNA (uracil1498-N3)-methyltransferase